MASALLKSGRGAKAKPASKPRTRQNRFKKSRRSERNRALAVQLWRGTGLRILAVLALVSALYGGFVINEQLHGIAVERVVFAGDLQHINRDTLVRRASPFLEAGYLGLDLVAMRAELEREPWVYRAELERHWPRELKINIVEQRPIASWGPGGFLNHRGEVFEPLAASQVEGLPTLQGPEGSANEVMRQYRLMSQVLAEQNLQLEKLQMSAQGSWVLTLAGDVELVLGSDRLLEKLRRFALVYQRELAPQFDRIERIDSRYINGLAVSWNKQAQAGAVSLSGRG